MKIYDLLLNNRRPHLIAPSREYLYFQEHESLLATMPETIPFIDPKDGFSMICMNIIIDSILNYQKLVEIWDNGGDIRDSSLIQPLFVYNEVPIYCPLFSVSNNYLISNNMSGKLTINHDAIDLFETYHYALFESDLTSLVLVGEDTHTRAYYHYDFHTIYIINDQGRLDKRICLFDKHIKQPDYRNILERITPVIDAYYANDRSAFMNALLHEKLISQKIYNMYMNDLRRRKRG
jgi:hypothetical protein